MFFSPSSQKSNNLQNKIIHVIIFWEALFVLNINLNACSTALAPWGGLFISCLFWQMHCPSSCCFCLLKVIGLCRCFASVKILSEDTLKYEYSYSCKWMELTCGIWTKYEWNMFIEREQLDSLFSLHTTYNFSDNTNTHATLKLQVIKTSNEQKTKLCQYKHQSPCLKGTSVAVGVKQGCSVRKSSAVRIVVNCPYTRLVPTTVLPRNVDGIADTAIGQPAWVTLVQTGLPGQVQLTNSSQLGFQGMTVCGCRGQI